MALIIVELFLELANFELLVLMYIYMYNIYGIWYIYIYIILYLCLYIYMVFTTEGLFEVANIESWPEWDLNPRPLNSFQMF